MEAVLPSPGPSAPYPKDRNWGIAVLAISVLGVLLGGFLVAFGSFVSGAVAPLAQSAKPDPMDPTFDLVRLFPKALHLSGWGLIVVSAFPFAGGIGMMRGARWGFWVTAVTSGLAFLLDLLTFNVVSLLVSGFLFQYCLRRLNGKEGPLPV